MNARLTLLLLSSLTLGACSNLSSPAYLTRAYSEPDAGPRARLRVVTNGVVRLIPDADCHDESKGVGGIVANDFTTFLTDSHLNNQKLGMPSGITEAHEMTSEVYVQAGKPINIDFMSQANAGGGNVWLCASDWTFVPEEGKDYEVQGRQYGSQCLLSAMTLDGAKIGHPAPRKCPAK
ncbi:hypothetical protein [Silvimonas amylolytica]|uniref:Lipoprotein n=1 Tax=Silvimonas amylolytica TaxID=449663 RepID=A0ABQ2PK99_9NEIS|nr:hypothetical protein [Silvimonas amylolytica]GGP26045.1 hypothetical protein GCM10010971_18640 [Silvimonas amylolytica]